MNPEERISLYADQANAYIYILDDLGVTVLNPCPMGKEVRRGECGESGEICNRSHVNLTLSRENLTCHHRTVRFEMFLLSGIFEFGGYAPPEAPSGLLGRVTFLQETKSEVG